MKQRFTAAALPIAPYTLAKDEDSAVGWAQGNGYPVVVKPVRGAASQGVIRANNESELRQAYRRLRRIVREYSLDTGDRSDAEQLVEGYLDGAEYSVELLMQQGTPHVLCLFEKPEPLHGPFFEETIYVTPTRLPAALQLDLQTLAVRAVTALGLRNGPAHCELRLSSAGSFVLEVGARLIGGACSRAFRHVLGEDIHPTILRIALGEDVSLPQQQAEAAGAMMLPIPKEGRLIAVKGVDRAQRVPGIQDIILNTTPGEVIVPFPEQSCYVGFLTASGETPQAVEQTLATAASHIALELAPLECERWTRTITDQRSFQASDRYCITSLASYGQDEALRMVLPLVAAAYFGELPFDLAMEQARQCVDWLLAGNRGETSPATWLISDGQGVVLGAARGTTCAVPLLGVLPSVRRTGLGAALVRSVMAHYARQGCSHLEALVDPRQMGATGLFRRLGFVPEAADDMACCCTC
jgi:biotin carboxylase/ribosomal protein S18 acetylase RimI-like enzyme